MLRCFSALARSIRNVFSLEDSSCKISVRATSRRNSRYQWSRDELPPRFSSIIENSRVPIHARVGSESVLARRGHHTRRCPTYHARLYSLGDRWPWLRSRRPDCHSSPSWLRNVWFPIRSSRRARTRREGLSGFAWTYNRYKKKSAIAVHGGTFPKIRACHRSYRGAWCWCLTNRTDAHLPQYHLRIEIIY